MNKQYSTTRQFYRDDSRSELSYYAQGRLLLPLRDHTHQGDLAYPVDRHRGQLDFTSENSEMYRIPRYGVAELTS